MKPTRILKRLYAILGAILMCCNAGNADEPGAAPIDPKADDLLRRYVDALGGTRALETVTTRRMSGSVERFGNEVPHIRTQKAPNLLLLETRFPNPGVLKQGFNGSIGWIQHPLQGERLLEGNELVDFANQAWLQPALHLSEMYAVRKWLGPRNCDGADCTALSLAKKAGLPAETWFFNASSALLSRIEQTVDGGPKGEISVTMLFTDYRKIDGLMTPFAVKTIVGADNPAVSVFRVESLEHNLKVDDVIFQPSH